MNRKPRHPPKASDLVTNPETGRLSNTKLATATTYLLFALWFCVFNGLAVYLLLKDRQTPWLEGLWWAFMGVSAVAAGHQTLGKAIALRGPNPAPFQNPPQFQDMPPQYSEGYGPGAAPPYRPPYPPPFTQPEPP